MIGSGAFNRSRMPRTLVCYVCGRDYGSTSLGIHLKTCIRKFEVEQSRKPKRERRPLPTPPPGLLKLLDKKIVTELDLKEYNNDAYENFQENVLIGCKHCGRTFSESALKHHSRACTADKPFKPRPIGGDRNKSVDMASPSKVKISQVSSQNTINKSHVIGSKTPDRNNYTNASPKFGQNKISVSQNSNNFEVNESISDSPYDKNFKVANFRGYSDFKSKLQIHNDNSYYENLVEESESIEEEEEEEDSEEDVDKYEYQIVSRIDEDFVLRITKEELQRFEEEILNSRENKKDNKKKDKIKFERENSVKKKINLSAIEDHKSPTKRKKSAYEKIEVEEEYVEYRQPTKNQKAIEKPAYLDVPGSNPKYRQKIEYNNVEEANPKYRQKIDKSEYTDVQEANPKYRQKIDKSEYIEVQEANPKYRQKLDKSADIDVQEENPKYMQKHKNNYVSPNYEPDLSEPEDLQTSSDGDKDSSNHLENEYDSYVEEIEESEESIYSDDESQQDQVYSKNNPNNIYTDMKAKNINVSAKDAMYNQAKPKHREVVEQRVHNRKQSFGRMESEDYDEDENQDKYRKNPKEDYRNNLYANKRAAHKKQYDSESEEDYMVEKTSNNRQNEQPSGNTKTTDCRKCGRNFATDRIDKHEKVCKGNSQPIKAKLFHKPAPIKNNDKSPGKNSKWRKQHEDFMNVMKYNKVIEDAERKGIDIRTLPPPPDSGPDPTLVPCPYCGRRFGAIQADKHIPNCKETVNRPAPPPSRRKIGSAGMNKNPTN